MFEDRRCEYLLGFLLIAQFTYFLGLDANGRPPWGDLQTTSGNAETSDLKLISAPFRLLNNPKFVATKEPTRKTLVVLFHFHRGQDSNPRPVYI